MEVVGGWRSLLPLNIHMFHDDCVMASMSRQESSKAIVALRLVLYNRRLGEGTRTENQGGQSSSSRCGVNSVNVHLSTLHLPGELPGETDCLGEHVFPTASHDEVSLKANRTGRTSKLLE